MTMTKEQLLKRIKNSTEMYVDKLNKMAGHANKVQNYDGVVLVEAISVSCCGIVDVLNNIAIILCETLTEEE